LATFFHPNAEVPMRQLLPDIRWPAEYAKAGFQSVRSRLERQPAVKQLGVQVDQLLRTFDRTARKQAPRTVETVDWLLRQALGGNDSSAAFPSRINATGTIFSPAASVPWADTAVAAYCRLAGDSHGTGAEDLLQGHQVVRDELQQLAGCEAAFVFANCATAASLAMEAIDGGGARRLIVPKQQVVQFAGVPLPQLAVRSNVQLVEVGTVDVCTAVDFGNALADDSCRAVLLIASGNVPKGDNGDATQLADLATAARHANKRVLLLTDEAIPVECDLPHCLGVFHLPKAASLADLLVMPGDRLLGGPACGILMGDKNLVQAARSSSWAVNQMATLPTLAALVATLKLWATAELRTNLPMWQLLMATAETIDLRTARLIEQCDGEPFHLKQTESAVRLYPSPFGGSERRLPAVRVTSDRLSGSQLQQQLSQSLSQIACHLDETGQGIILQLATVLPRQDAQLAAALRALLAEK
jgi:L-seryl-tRNA(Ser) seleniumtransferase